LIDYIELKFRLVFTDSDPEGSVDNSTAATQTQPTPTHIKQPPVIYLRQYIWPMFTPSSLPACSLSLNHFYEQFKRPHMPCVMRQVIINTGDGNPSPSHHQEHQIIESHSYMPIFY
jgi:hypothetical protein